jgi:hypothetical protein
MNAADLRVYSSGPALVAVESVGINPYKMVELHFKYRPHVPIEYQENILYRQPDSQVMSIVKEERSEQSVFWVKLKETKLAGMKARLESIAYLDDDGNVDIAADNDDGTESNC